MCESKRRSSRALEAVVGLPYSFMAGLLVGIAAPVAAVAGMVLMVRLLTGKVPFLSDASPAEGDDRRVSLRLMPPDEARTAFERERSRISGDLNRLSTEIQGLAEHARAKAGESLPRSS